MHGHLNVIFARLHFTCYFIRMCSTISLIHRKQTQHGSVCDEWPESTTEAVTDGFNNFITHNMQYKDAHFWAEKL